MLGALRSRSCGDAKLVAVLELETPHLDHWCFMTSLPHCLMQREVENIVENSYMNLSVWELGLKDCAGSCEALNSDDDSVIVN